MPHSEGSFIRWQAITITQLGYAVNLILGSATASLGFALTLAKDKEYAPGCWGKCLWGFSVLLLLISVALGLWCVINRLRDFRKTKDIAKDREEMERANVAEAEIRRKLEMPREETRRIGETTWTLFNWQLGTFATAIPLLMIAFAV